MNITKDQIKEWVEENTLDSKAETENTADLIHHCIQVLTPKWVSVDEMLPQDDFSVIARVGDDVSECIFRMLDDGSYYFDGLFGVTHWIPLPEPPK